MVVGDIISVIIGVIFIWALLGVAVMQIQEWTVGWLSLRADSLEDAIRGMLMNPKPRLGPWGRFREQIKKRAVIRSLPWIQPDMPPALVQAFYSHPLIRSLEQERANPSYLPTKLFSQVLLDTVMVAGLDAPAISRALIELKKRWPEAASQDAGQTLQGLVKLVDEVAGLDSHPKQVVEMRQQLAEFRTLSAKQGYGKEDEKNELVDLLEAALRDQLPRDIDGVMACVERGSAALFAASPLLQQRLEVLTRQVAIDAATAAERLSLLRLQIESWFDDTMDHVTGWYKRNRQWGAFAIGLVIAAFLNLDSIQITTALWRQPVLREALAAAAAQELEAQALEPEVVAPGVMVEQVEDSLSALSVPFGWQFTPVSGYDSTSHVCRLFPDSRGEVGGLGWNGKCLRWQDAPKGWGILTKLVGIIITAAAAMQGAPFWFDVLDKVLPIRAAGIRPGERAASKKIDEGPAHIHP